jgi:hypothetical protein
MNSKQLEAELNSILQKLLPLLQAAAAISHMPRKLPALRWTPTSRNP